MDIELYIGLYIGLLFFVFCFDVFKIFGKSIQADISSKIVYEEDLESESTPCNPKGNRIISKTQSNSYENLDPDNNSAHINSPSLSMNIQEMNVHNTNEIQNICAIESALTLQQTNDYCQLENNIKFENANEIQNNNDHSPEKNN